ncbi:MAG: hypothetical protein CM1200mP9_04480 [Gammaproteobacteria bacterium]|nr:MAG: hypothetical protein CM1200mP9_04480 [Gammaproteobacteria bacterium]
MRIFPSGRRDPRFPGQRTEIKNVNSFRFVEKALRYEIERQIAVLESGGDVILETRLYDSERERNAIDAFERIIGRLSLFSRP